MAYSDQDFENELRDKLRTDAPLPPGMDWEAIREGVNQKVGRERKSKRPFLIWWLPGIGVALLLVAGVIGYQLRPSNASPQQAQIATEVLLPKQSTTQSNGSAMADATGFSIEDHNSGQTTPLPKNELDQKVSIQSTTNAPLSKTSPPTQPRLQAGEAKTSKGPSNIGIASPAVTGVANSTYTNEDVQAPAAILPKTEALAMLPFQRHLFRAEGDVPPSFNVNIEGIKNTKKQEGNEEETPAPQTGSKRWFIDILAGTQFAGAAYRGDNPTYAMLRSETETPLPGHHLAIGIGKKVGEKWQFRTGLSYDRIRTLTDYEGMRVIDSSFQNVPLRVINGDTTYGVAILQVRESRELKSFQREQRLSVPVLIGRNFRWGKNLLIVRAGPEFGLLIGSGGKVLAADRSVHLLSDADFQPLSISARLEGELAIPLGENGPLLIGRIGLRSVLGGGQLEIRRTGNSVVGGIGIRLPL